MALARLLGDAPLETFMECFLRAPYAQPGGAGHLLPLGSWNVIGRILNEPGVDTVVGRQAERWPGNRTPTASEARALVAEGYTLGIRHAERHDPGLGALAEQFERDFLAPVDIHIYCTPEGSPGFGWHYDAEDVFVLQTVGSKLWELRKNTVNPWPLVETLPTDMQHARETMPVMRCTLAAGDWLYIPAGYWHRTEAGAESISLSIGILSPAAISVCDFLREFLTTSLRWRQRLPPVGQTSTLGAAAERERYQILLSELGDDLAKLLRQDEIVDSFLQYRRAWMDRRK